MQVVFAEDDEQLHDPDAEGVGPPLLPLRREGGAVPAIEETTVALMTAGL